MKINWDPLFNDILKLGMREVAGYIRISHPLGWCLWYGGPGNEGQWSSAVEMRGGGMSLTNKTSLFFHVELLRPISWGGHPQIVSLGEALPLGLVGGHSSNCSKMEPEASGPAGDSKGSLVFKLSGHYLELLSNIVHHTNLTVYKWHVLIILQVNEPKPVCKEDHLIHRLSFILPL